MRYGRMALLVSGCAAAAIATRGGEPQSGGLKGSPANTWVRMPGGSEWAAYDFSQPVYAPSRKQLLHWGAVLSRYNVKSKAGNDVRAFDAAAGRWVSDYPSSDKAAQGVTGGGSGKALSFAGLGSMLADGRPQSAIIVNGVCWDSKRKRVVYTMAGLTVAYDPESKTWTDLKAKGIPKVYGVGSCYDPVNDEMVLFPHFRAENRDMVPVHGRVFGHDGTYRMSFKDMTWKRVSDTFGSAEVKSARSALLKAMTSLSRAGDLAYGLRRRKDLCKPEEVGEALKAALAGLGGLNLPGGEGAELVKAAQDSVQKAGPAVAGGKWDDVVSAVAKSLGKLDALLEGPLRVEPPARCAAPMIYDPARQVIVMFGGHSGLVRNDLKGPHHLGDAPGALNDTWIYDCRTRQWRELDCKIRPPEIRRPQMFREPESGLMVLVDLADKATDFWTLDVAAGKWSLRGSVPLNASEATIRTTGSSNTVGSLGYDENSAAVVFVQNEGRGDVPATYALRLDLKAMTAGPASAWKPQPAIIEPQIPADDPAWVAKLKSLPANTWIAGAQGPGRRDWGNAACDPVRGHVYYFGGGHSTYQVNDVAVYAVGANRWVFEAGDHNDYVPPVGWGGSCLGFRGGMWAHHQRNEYVAIDGRMYCSTGGWEKQDKYNPGTMNLAMGRVKGPRWAHFRDQDRGGVWRKTELPYEEIVLGEKVDGVWGACSVVDPRGYILGFAGDKTQYYGDSYPNVYVSIYDVYRGKLEVRNTGAPHPERVEECRPFCFVGGRNAIFFYERGKRGHRTWLYDVEKNAWTDLKPPRQPNLRPDTVEYLEGQDAVILLNHGNGRKPAQWVYSFERNQWAPLPHQGVDVYVNNPYGQVVYSLKYGVLVGVAGSTKIMRPDFSKVDWGGSRPGGK